MGASTRWRKVIRDFTAYRLRSAAVVASIAVGVFAVGTIAGAYALLDSAFEDAAAEGRPASATLFTAAGFAPDLVESIERMDGVAVAQARRTVGAWLEPGDGEAGSSGARGATEIQLIALADYDDQQIDRVLPRAGEFPPDRGEIVFERSALRLVDVAPGTVATVRTAAGEERRLRVAGLAYEPGASPAYYFGRVNAYVTRETLADLGWPATYNELRIRTDDTIADREGARSVADAVRQRIERAGTPVTFMLVAEPGSHPAQEIVGAVFLVLGAIGFLSLFVAGFLILNTVNVLMAQHVRQIGIMKVVGAGAGQITALYLALVALYGVAGIALAVPLAAAASLGLATFVGGLLNVDVPVRMVPLPVLALEAAAGLGVPLLAALRPIRRGVADHRPARPHRHGPGRALRPRRLRPPPGPGPGPLAAAPPLDPEHVPAQGPARAHARGTDGRRCRVHDHLQRPRLALRHARRHGPLLRLRRPGPALRARPRLDGRRGGAARAGNHRGRAVAFASAIRQHARRQREPVDGRVRPGPRRPDTVRRSSPRAAGCCPGRATRSSRRRTSGATTRTWPSATSPLRIAGRRHGLDRGRDRPVADVRGVHVRGRGRARRGDRRR
jgi:hypothetical protein